MDDEDGDLNEVPDVAKKEVSDSDLWRDKNRELDLFFFPFFEAFLCRSGVG